MTHYLYLITRDDGERYIGVTNNPDKRLKQHITGQGNKHLEGETSLQMQILLSGPKTKIYELENYFIEDFGTLNIASGGQFTNQNGEANHQAKLSEEQVLEIRNLANNNFDLSYEQIGNKYGVSREAIGNICKHKRWNHVGGPKIENRYKQTTNIIDHKKVDELFKKGLKPLEIAATLKCCKSSVYKTLTKLGYNLTKLQAEKKKAIKEKCKELHNLGVMQKDIAIQLNISSPTVRKYLKENI